MRPQRLKVSLQTIAVLALLLVFSGCKVTGEDIEYWKGTIKGPGKIVAVLLSDKYPMELRTQAAMALVEMERNDVDGVAELQRALQRIDDKTRLEIVDAMVPKLEALMKGEGSAQQEDDELTGPPPRQVRAKDAAYLLTSHANPQARKKLIDAVVGWYTVDFNGRSLAGHYSAEQIIRSLGAPAASRLVEALNAQMPQRALVKIAELIGQLGSDETKARAAERLVKIEKEMEGKEFLGWLKDKIGDSLEEQGRDVEDKRILAVAAVNREKFINEGALPAMKHLGDQKIVVDRLLEIASTEPDEKSAKHMTERRKKALQALEGHVSEKHLEQVLALALGEDNPVPVRDYAFDRVGDIRSKKAIPELWPLVANGDNEEDAQRLRWRAGELVLAIGGKEVVSKFLEELPSGQDVEYAAQELEGFARRMGQMKPPPEELVVDQLDSDQWWDRVIGLRFLERKGTEEDIPRMKKLIGDEAEVKGPNWEEGWTVGDVAKDAIEKLKERLAEPEGEGEGKGSKDDESDSE
ncbi:MAG: hypothetical protein ACOCUS_04745 [Polyangiales bacterium]